MNAGVDAAVTRRTCSLGVEVWCSPVTVRNTGQSKWLQEIPPGNPAKYQLALDHHLDKAGPSELREFRPISLQTI